VATDQTGKKRRLWGCGIAILCMLIGSTVGYGFLTGYLPIRPFDADLWQQGMQSHTAVRLHMIEPLIRSRNLDGLTRSQVVSLLGPPSNDGYFADWDLVYWLGPERGLMRIDSEWLVIRIGPDGRVSDYRIARD
jgi:hypothetical protein